MAYEVRRVPLDFAWPIGQDWIGNRCPYVSEQCVACSGQGVEPRVLDEDPPPCWACGGEGEFWYSPEIRALADAWEGYGPPVGEGYQWWETVGDSPLSPVYATREEADEWARSHRRIAAPRL